MIAENARLVWSFLLTRLMRGVTSLALITVGKIAISTHTPHARRDELLVESGDITDISTHTPHARRDLRTNGTAPHSKDFYSHASCEA